MEPKFNIEIALIDKQPMKFAVRGWGYTDSEETSITLLWFEDESVVYYFPLTRLDWFTMSRIVQADGTEKTA